MARHPRLGEPGAHPGEVLCALGRAVDDVTPYLAAWAADGRAPASRHLVTYVIWEYEPVKARLANTSWEDREDQAEQVIGWLHTAPVTERLTELAMAPREAELADAAQLALQSLLADGR